MLQIDTRELADNFHRPSSTASQISRHQSSWSSYIHKNATLHSKSRLNEQGLSIFYIELLKCIYKERDKIDRLICEASRHVALTSWFRQVKHYNVARCWDSMELAIDCVTQTLDQVEGCYFISNPRYILVRPIYSATKEQAMRGNPWLRNVNKETFRTFRWKPVSCVMQWVHWSHDPCRPMSGNDFLSFIINPAFFLKSN